MADAGNDRSSVRRQRLLSDIDLIMRVCTKDKNNPFCQFEFESDSFSFEYRSGTTRIFYQISLSDSYPDHSIMMSCVNASAAQQETTHFSDRLPVLFNKLAAKMYKPLDLDVVDDTELMKTPKKLSFPCAGKTRVYCRGSSDDDDDDDEDSSMDSGDVDDDANDHIDIDDYDVDSQLIKDIESVKTMYGADMISCHYLKAIGDVDIELSVPTKSLDVEISKAWNLVHQQPLTIVLNLSMSRYRTGQEPTLEVLQYSLEGNKEKSGAHKQMEKILERFIAENWKKAHGTERVAAASDGSTEHGRLKPLTLIKKYVSKPKLKPAFNDCDVQRIMEIGYTRDVSICSLEACHGDVNQACDTLLEYGEDFLSNPQCNGALAPTVTQYEIAQRSVTPEPIKKKAKSEPLPPEKVVPSSAHGFLVQLMLYAAQRLNTLNEFCVVCDERHLFENSSMLKPVVCSRELCVFAFQTLGVMADAADEVATAAEVVDLLVAMARAAVQSARKQLIFEPYPSVVDPNDKTRLAFSPEKKNMKLVSKTLQSIPPTWEMVTKSRFELKKTIDKLDPLAHPLLQWIVSSNRCHIVKLPPHKQLRFMQTPHQFLLLSSPPAKEAVFCDARNQHGSTFAFHGSRTENWHSILRRGLLNASRTQLEVNGTAYGDGIYLSPSTSVSLRYSLARYSSQTIHRPQQPQLQSEGVSQFLTSDDITCIALCEVVTSNQLRKHRGIWVMPDADQVCTRFFFVYENGPPTSCDVDSQSSDIKRDIERVLGMIFT